jgi:hypothetical protein
MVHSTKMYPTDDCTFFQVLARVMSGTLYANQDVRVLGENYTAADEEDSRVLTVGRLWIFEARLELDYFSLLKLLQKSVFKTKFQVFFNASIYLLGTKCR